MPKWLTISELIKILVLLVTIVGLFFSLDNRMSMAEHAIQQETLGYRFMQDQMGKRIDRIDTRLANIEGLLMDRH